MNVAVLGLWHLGTVTAACLAAGGHDVTGIDFEAPALEGLRAGRAPIFEPGLDALVAEGLATGTLRFTSEAGAAAEADVVVVAYDTPVDEDDRGDVEYVVERVARLIPHLRNGARVVIMSQLPVGTTRRLEAMFQASAGGRRVAFAYCPENLRLGEAIQVFTRPDRVVVGVRRPEEREALAQLWRPFTDRLEWMSVESAEMTKHALNAFLATSVAFINEIATVCEQVGADAAEVARGLKSDVRIGPKAYLSPGGAFAGGTLARDVVLLSELGQTLDLGVRLLPAVKASNDAHRRWPERQLLELLGDLARTRVAVWGLAYKAGTDTLRRSSAVELCRWLARHGATARAHDPAVRALPHDLRATIELVTDPVEAARGASALVIATPWPAYRDVPVGDVLVAMTRPLVLDPNRFLGDTFGNDRRCEYVSVGRRRSA